MSRRGPRPRAAASLVVLDLGRGEPRVLMGRRPPRDRFMPDVWVFPGGRVDPGDAVAPARSELRSGVARRLRSDAAPPLDRALAVAALRETYEETGLVAGERRGDAVLPDLAAVDYLARAITPAGNPIRYHARFFAIEASRLAGRPAASEELAELAWWPLDRARSLPLVDVTRFVLDEAWAWAARRRRPGPVPLVHYRRGVLRIRR